METYNFKGYTARFEGKTEAVITRDTDGEEVLRTMFRAGDDIIYLKELLKTYLALRGM